MKQLQKSIKTRYLVFITTAFFIIVLFTVAIQRGINDQYSNVEVVKKTGEILVSFQKMNRTLNSLDTITVDDLRSQSLEWERAHTALFTNSLTKKENPNLNALLNSIDNTFQNILKKIHLIIEDPNKTENHLQAINDFEIKYIDDISLFLNQNESITKNHQNELQYLLYILLLISTSILILEFLFVLLPIYKKSLAKNRELYRINNQLLASRTDISLKMDEVNRLKTNLETQQKLNKIFIDQAPTAIAMLDNNMRYLAVSQRWTKDYKMEGHQIIGRSHYDVFPEIGHDWKKKHQDCLNGAIDICDEAPFKRSDGTVQWIYWDVRPWYVSEGKIGGLLMHTGDITSQKQREKETLRTEKILEKTNKVARIGTWELDIEKDEYLLSDIASELFNVPIDSKMNRKKIKSLYKEGKSRTQITESMKTCIENGTPFDLELELITNNGKNIWVREIAQAEFINGRCKKVFGILQDITPKKLYERKLYELNFELSKVNNELNTILDAGPMAIISIDNEGFIQHFNKGAQLLLGYTSNEVVGLEKPEIYLLENELDNFKKNLAKKYNIGTLDFDPITEISNRNDVDSREWTYVKKDGTVIPVYVTLTSIKNEHGKPVGFLSVAVDISKLKNIENELVNKNKLLVRAEKITKMGHWQWDAVNDKVKWSDNLHDILGYDKDILDVTKATYFDFVHEEDREDQINLLEQMIDQRRYLPNTHRIRSTNNTIKTVLLLGEMILNDQGELIEIIGTLQDITEQNAAKEKIIQAKNNLEVIATKLTKQNVQLADFAQIASHNLRAPVSNLNSLLYIYKLSDTDDEKMILFEKFESVIGHLTTTLNNLVEAIKTKNDHATNTKHLSFKSILEKTKDILAGEIIASNAIINYDFNEAEIVNYNEAYLESIFLNLIENAIKYRSNDRVPEVHISTYKDEENKILLKIRDNGLGINMERHSEKIFGLNKTFHDHSDAKGVGLFMTKTQIEAMGGEISVNSNVNIGTEFCIIF
ncbi:PAS domain-containing sensor histidine kinase [Sediminibacter sp. Hel_I_10]|uniref:PAS domain-containing sensor histidine kinase n=1 Tax=Sediminibacter sp. Hel_I_10 TaxID=1392490 RepID=UPI00047A6803|nr:PAS domain-containing sensor histidine kinase [Sediminibacter sp. Hel_I_10]